MKIGFASDYSSPPMDELLLSLCEELADRGHVICSGALADFIPDDVNLVFNVTRPEAPRANTLRTNPAHFICTVVETSRPPGDVRREAYRALVKTMSNLLAYVVHRPDEPTSYLVTPELGFRAIPHGPQHVRRIVDQVLAISDVRFVVENELVEDLPAALHDGDQHTRTMARIGARLDALGLLPSILPLDEILSERERRLLMKLFGIRQLSYGNLSTRLSGDSFWMSGRGVDKGKLEVVGRDVLLVTGADETRVRVSVPPGTDPSARVSVDAIEHAMLYRAFPGVGAILHLHAWIPGIPSTLQSYPCGTLQLAREVLALVGQAPDPENAVIGLRNHGITATGADLDAIFQRIAGRLERQVPMV